MYKCGIMSTVKREDKFVPLVYGQAQKGDERNDLQESRDKKAADAQAYDYPE